MEGLDLFDICRYGNLYLLKLIMTRENVNNLQDNYGVCALELCIEYGHLNCVTWLVDELDATINDLTIVFACNTRMYACLEFLLQRKSNCNISRLLFSYTTSPRIIELLLNAKANPNVQHFGETALEWVIKHTDCSGRSALLIIDAGGTAKDVPKHIYDYYETTHRKRKNYNNAMIALYFVLRRYKVPKDIIKVMINMIRPSRNSELWIIKGSLWNQIIKWVTLH
jgi:hypothetical protein